MKIGELCDVLAEAKSAVSMLFATEIDTLTYGFWKLVMHMLNWSGFGVQDSYFALPHQAWK
jgi:hypothetical protein